MKSSDQKQLINISLEDLVPANHNYRKFLTVLDFDVVIKPLSSLETAQGYEISTLFRCLLLQFLEDLSDRELERYLQDNLSAKYFAGFGLTDQTPNYSLFSRTRKKIGTHKLSQLFSLMREQLKARGYMNEVFTFIDASHLIAKANLWEERDKAIKAKYEKLNNQTLPKVAHDKQAKVGCKGKDKFWYGYKLHMSCDMQDGLINKVAITPANITDARGIKHVLPKSGAIYADKGYCIKPAVEQIEKRGLHNATIKLNHMKAKNHDKDKWLSHLRMPYERIFSQRERRTRYKGIEKNQFSGFMQAIAHNLKRLVVLEELYPQTNHTA